ncbi:pentapeptide repeat-containing protein [bacterium]|nr:pentapeptide repeat-containing protein [bacterium]
MDRDWLTSTEAAELLSRLTGRPLRRQRLQQLCSEGRLVYRDMEVVRHERRISRASIEQLARTGLPRERSGGGHVQVQEELRGRDLRGVILHGAQLRGRDLRDADLRNADLSGANLQDADLRGADLRNAGLTGAVLDNADLRGARLEGCDLSGASLAGADLSE